MILIVICCFATLLNESVFLSTVSPRFMRELRSAKTSHKLKSHISNALTYRENGVACNNVKYVSNAF
jgi:hypothetical protein